MKQYFQGSSPYSIKYDPKVFDALGWTTVKVLPELVGKRWSPLTLGFVHGLKPHSITITHGEKTCDGDSDRVTVYIDKGGIIKNVTLGICVGLPSGVQNGGDAQEKLSRELGIFYAP